VNPNGMDDADRPIDAGPRYREVRVGDGELVIHDRDDHRAWIHSTVALDLVENR